MTRSFQSPPPPRWPQHPAVVTAVSVGGPGRGVALSQSPVQAEAAALARIASVPAALDDARAQPAVGALAHVPATPAAAAERPASPPGWSRCSRLERVRQAGRLPSHPFLARGLCGDDMTHSAKTGTQLNTYLSLRGRVEGASDCEKPLGCFTVCRLVGAHGRSDAHVKHQIRSLPTERATEENVPLHEPQLWTQMADRQPRGRKKPSGS